VTGVKPKEALHELVTDAWLCYPGNK